MFPFLTIDLFDKLENKSIVKCILKYFKEYDKIPTISDMKLEIVKDEDGYTYFVEVINTDISEYNDEFLLDKIEEFFRKKLIFHDITKAVDYLKDNEDEKLLSIPESIRTSIGFSFDTNVGMAVFTDEGEERMYNHLHTDDEQISTGLKELDVQIGGGFHKKSVSVLLGQGNIGKTLIACGIAANNILQNKKVLYITMELTEEYITQRILQNLFDLNQFEIKQLSREEFHRKYQELKERIGNLLIVKKYSPGINCSHIRHLLKECEMKIRFKPDILYVDYLGELDSVKEGNNSNDIGKYKCQELEGIAFDYDVPLITPAQVNRGGYSTSSLDPTDVADSIGIFTETDLVIGITQTQEQYEATPSTYTLDILKNRFGERLKRVSIGVERTKMRLFDLNDIDKMKIEDEKNKNNTTNELSSIIRTGMAQNKQEKFRGSILFD